MYVFDMDDQSFLDRELSVYSLNTSQQEYLIPILKLALGGRQVQVFRRPDDDGGHDKQVLPG
jgi:hypothetical protein